MVRSDGKSSNSISASFDTDSQAEDGPCPDVEEHENDVLLDELERWNEVLKPHAHHLRGPRP